MLTTVLILAGIAVLLLMVALARIASLLCDLRLDLRQKHLNLVSCYYDLRKDLRNIHESLDGDGNTGAQAEKKLEKQREYWRDQNGFMHWRKKDA
jgi:hypothetical protein